MYQRPDAPLSIGGVLDDGFRLLKSSFGKLFLLALISSFFGQIPNYFIGGTPAEQLEAVTSTALPWLGISFLLSLIFYGALIARVQAVANGENLSMGGAIGVGAGRFFPMLACFILYSLAVAAGILALVIPGIILSLSLIFAPYLVITDRLGPVAAIKRSHNLVWGNWWRTAGILTVVIFIIIAAYFLMGLLAALQAAFGTGGADGGPSFFVYIFAALMAAIISPLVYAFSMSILNDLKLRKEGADLDARMGEIENA
jgi:hypothetical protein